MEIIEIGRNQQKNSRFISMGTIKSASASWRSLMKLTCNNFVALLVLLIILASNNNNTSALIVTVGVTTPPPLAVFHFFFIVVATLPINKSSIGFC